MTLKKTFLPVLYSLSIILFTGFLSSCDSDESFTVDKASWLTFSSDTISFDTIVTNTGSSTRRFQVYNTNKNGLRLTTVKLVGGADSPYRVNIDGTFLGPEDGYATSGMELYGGDSLFVFVDIIPKEVNSNTPQLLNDEIEFILESGLRQTVKLKAYGQDVDRFYSHTLTTDTTLTAERPIVIFDSLIVAPGVTLTLQPGVQLYFHDKANLHVHGTIKALGTLSEPVIFRGDRTDRMFDYLPYDNTPGRWGGIILHSESKNNYFNYSDIHSASFGIRSEASSVDDEKLTIENSILHNIEGHGIELISTRATIGNTQISNTMGNCVDLTGGEVEFIHCTLAQFYPWDAGRGNALVFRNVDSQGVAHPLTRADFRNCLLTGYSDDELYGNSTQDESVPFNFTFTNCFLNTVNSDSDSRMLNIRYDLKTNELYKSKNFKLFDTRNFLYNFELDSLSTAVNAGDAVWSGRYPTDRNGVNRLSDEAPDAGCYEFKPNT